MRAWKLASHQTFVQGKSLSLNGIQVIYCQLQPSLHCGLSACFILGSHNVPKLLMSNISIGTETLQVSLYLPCNILVQLLNFKTGISILGFWKVLCTFSLLITPTQLGLLIFVLSYWYYRILCHFYSILPRHASYPTGTHVIASSTACALHVLSILGQYMFLLCALGEAV